MAGNNWASSNMALNTNKGGLVSNTGHWGGDGVLGNGNSWGSGIAMSNGWGSCIAVSNGWGSNGSWVSDGWDGSNGLNVNVWLSSWVNLASGIMDVGLSRWVSLTAQVMQVGLSSRVDLSSNIKRGWESSTDGGDGMSIT